MKGEQPVRQRSMMKKLRQAKSRNTDDDALALALIVVEATDLIFAR